MRNITVKNIPDDLYEKIKAAAQNNRRSINNEMINRLDKSLTSTRVDADLLIRRIEHFHSKIEMPLLTDDLIQKTKQEGRS